MLKPEGKSRVLSRIGLFIKSIPKNLALLLIYVYRHGISPMFPPSFRYVPTCSEYAMIAIQRYGFFKGGRMAIKRILRCHPWHPGGYDPVP